MGSLRATVISGTSSMVAGEPYPVLALRKADGEEPSERLLYSLKEGCWGDWTGSLGDVCVCGGHWAYRVPSGGLDCE
jgi:hypothetical protein